MYGKTKKNKVRNENFRRQVGITPIKAVKRAGGLRAGRFNRKFLGLGP